MSTQKCGSSSCSNPAVVTVMWPGQPTPMCLPCMDRAIKVNNAMDGLPLAVIPLVVPVVEIGGRRE